MDHNENTRALEVCKTGLQQGARWVSALIQDDLNALAACCVCPLKRVKQEGLQVWKVALQTLCQAL